MSPSVSRRSSKGRRESKHSVSPARGRARHPQRRSPSKRDRSPDGSPRRSPSRRGRSPASSPRRRSPYRRERPPAYHKSSLRGSSPTREKHSGRNKSPILEKSNSPEAGSPSPRTKRLRRAQAEKEVEKAIEREREGSHRRGSDKSKHQDRGSSREGPRRERRSEKDGADGGSSRSRHGRSTSPSDHYHRSHHHSHSPPPASNSRARDEGTNSRGTDDWVVDDDSLAKMKAAEEALESKKKHQPSFELSGKLAAETNRVKGITLLFNEPPDARKPNIRWRLYVFKAGEVLNEPLYVHRQSCYLFGRERRVADIPTDHPSCSKQHAVLQFRQVEKEQPDGMMLKQTRPYLMDLGSTNKTFINDSPLEPQRYYELFEKDTIKFGNSSREYVLLHENSLE